MKFSWRFFCGLLVLWMAATGFADDGIEGKITKTDPSNGLIEVSGVPINVQNARIEDSEDHSMKIESLKVGVWVEVEGAFDEKGSLTAREVEIKRCRFGKLSGRVKGVDADKKMLTVNGIQVTVLKGAVLEGFHDQPILLGEIKAGDLVECEGQWTGERMFTAVKIELD